MKERERGRNKERKKVRDTHEMKVGSKKEKQRREGSKNEIVAI